LELSQAMNSAVEKVARIMDSSGAWLCLQDEEKNAFKLVARGLSSDAIASSQKGGELNAKLCNR
jgi:hypothetical protein